MKRYALAAAAALLASGLAMPAVAEAAPMEPVTIAMASYAASTAGDDAAAKIAMKKAAYSAHAKRHAAGDCHDCKDCEDCAECADCAEQKKVAEAKAGICDPAAHATGKVKRG
ncbi:hypothetical protein [Croceicoccus marinus]|uniref:Uncharacterized protein n=1 Tax=Croceicoccus marinus TaxID=450378 RepID=A0A7G6W150_9SPHN|nr:hypothetical protein [Croceicoccus marinus]QNE07715.1 hypothetical protein H4O24_20025 [Croceicoccus marinus]